MKENVNHYTAEGLLLLVTVFWGTSFYLIKETTETIDVGLFNTLRFSISTLAFLPFAYNQLKKMNWKDIKRGGILGFFLFGGFLFQALGLQQTNAANSAFITGLFVILVPLLVAFLYRRLPRIYSIIGSILGFTGLGLMSLQGFSINIGDILTFICAIFFAFQILYTEDFAKKSSPYILNFIQLLVVTLLSVASLPFFERYALLDGRNVFSIVFLAVFATALAYYLQTSMQRFTTAVKTAVIFTMEPVFGTLIAVGVGGEFLTPVQWVGGGIIILGILVSEIGENLFLKLKILVKGQ